MNIRKGATRTLLVGAAWGWGSAARAAEPLAAAPAGDTGVATWQVLTMLVYLAVLAGGALFILRWKKLRGHGPSGPGRQIEVIETRRVTPAATVLVIKVRGKSYLAVTSGTGVALQALPDEAT